MRGWLQRGPAGRARPAARCARRCSRRRPWCCRWIRPRNCLPPTPGPRPPRFLELLAALVQHEAGVTPAMIVALTIRADRYEPLQIAPQLAGVQAGLFDELKPMPPAGYTEVITGPARRATAAGRRLSVEPALVERLLADTAESADALPLLALTLARLYRRLRRRRQSHGREYEHEAMGGMRPGGADRGRHDAGRRPRAAPGPTRAPARRVHPVAGHHQPRQRPAHAPPGALGRPARRRPPADPGDGGKTAAGQRHPRR